AVTAYKETYGGRPARTGDRARTPGTHARPAAGGTYGTALLGRVRHQGCTLGNPDARAAENGAPARSAVLLSTGDSPKWTRPGGHLHPRLQPGRRDGLHGRRGRPDRAHRPGSAAAGDAAPGRVAAEGRRGDRGGDAAAEEHVRPGAVLDRGQPVGERGRQDLP